MIPFFNYPALFEQRKKEYLEVIHDVLSRGAYIMQQDLFEFETQLAEYLDVKHAIGVADGTMALLTSLMASDIKDGDEIILPSHTFVASAAAIHHAGAKPVLVECSADHLIDPDSIVKAITDRTSAIMPVQLNGRVSKMNQIEEISENHNIKIIEDSCQSLGAKYNNRFAGTFGIAGTFSFFPAKTLGCFGDGGAVITDNDDIADRVRMIRDHGRDPADGKVKLFGFNSRLDNIQAAILSVKLKYYDEDISRRREIASMYNEKLKNCESLSLPPPPCDGINFDVYQNYEIQASNRDGLREYLDLHGVGTIIQWGGNMVHQFEDLDLNRDLPYTEELSRNFMMLPMHPMLKDEDITYISKKIIEFYSK